MIGGFPYQRDTGIARCFHITTPLQYIPRNMHTVFALLCFVVVIHLLFLPYPSGLLHWHCGNLTIATVPAKQPWWIWINTSGEFIMNDCITTTKQSTTKPCAYFLGYTVWLWYANLSRFKVATCGDMVFLGLCWRLSSPKPDWSHYVPSPHTQCVLVILAGQTGEVKTYVVPMLHSEQIYIFRYIESKRRL